MSINLKISKVDFHFYKKKLSEHGMEPVFCGRSAHFHTQFLSTQLPELGTGSVNICALSRLILCIRKQDAS